MTERTIHLKTPLVLKTKTGEVIDTITSITLRPLQGGDFLSALDAAMGADGAMKVGTLLRHLTVKSSGVPADRINKLDPEDLFSVLEAVQDFLPVGRAIGLNALSSSSEPSDTPQTSPGGDPAN